tara:strand:- start:1940 stop:2206 length:267 start_codon:yes stop_codon:yes gene_type:complete
MEKLDLTLEALMKANKLTSNHIVKLEKLFLKLVKTTYRHDDLHLNNIMWSDKLDDFRIIDWGIYYRAKKKTHLSKLERTYIRELKSTL